MKVINATGPTRYLAHRLRNDPQITPNDCNAAAAAIDALLDAIEAGGMVQPRPAPVMDLGSLMVLRVWHSQQAENAKAEGHVPTWHFHRTAVEGLNQYFPEGDRL